ncbi:MAG: 50S ribosomal protein L13 [Fimbriimonadaceae bacterium]
MNRTSTIKGNDIPRKWYVVDAAGVPVGRLAGQVAQLLRGKHKPSFQYNRDCGDYVIIINAEKAVLTGRKGEELVYWHTGWPGGLRSITREKMQAEHPVRVIEKAVWGMVPKNKLGHETISKLKVYAGTEHPHEAQNPEPYDVRQQKDKVKVDAESN